MLLGRERERATIGRLLEGTRAGVSAGLIVTGQPGVGKTTLLNYAREAAGGMRVLGARGLQAESSLSYSALADVLRPLFYAIDRLPEEQAAGLRAAMALGPPSPGDRFKTYAGALSLIAAAAEQGPILITIDDVHWLDPASAEALFFVSRRLTAEGVLMLFAARDSAEMPADPAGLPLLSLTGLDHDTSIELLGLNAKSTAPRVAEAIYAASGGNPLALIEISSLLTERQRSGRDPLPHQLPVGPRLVSAFDARLAALPEATRTVLLLAAAGPEAGMAVLRIAGGALGVDVATALTPAERAGLIDVGETLLFRHPLIRSAVYEGASPDQQRNAHRALAAASPAGSSGDRAWHLASASIEPDEAVAAALDQVGAEQMARSAYASALRAFERAAELSPDVSGQVRRLSDAALSGLLAGRGNRAIALLDRALPLIAEPGAHADAVLLREQIAIWMDRPMAAHASLVEEAGRIEADDPVRAAVLLTYACGPCFMAAEIVEAKRTASRALALAERAGVPAVIASAEIALGEALLLHGEPRGRELVRKALASPAGRQADLTHSMEVLYAADFLVYVEDFDIAGLLLENAIRGQRKAGAPALLPYPLSVRSELEFRTGRWIEAYADATEAVELASETGQLSSSTYCHVCLARLEAALGQTAESLGRLALARGLAERFGTNSIPSYTWSIEGFLNVGLENWQAAIECLTVARRETQLREMREPGVLRWHGDLIEAYLRVGSRGEAEVVLAELEGQAEVTGRLWARIAASRARGMMAGPENLERIFEETIALAETGGDPFELARTRLAYGEGLRRLRRRGEARTHFRSAIVIFEELGAKPWIQRTERELAATGERLQRRTGTTTGRGLTPQEMRVCVAVARGDTNREVATQLFLSLKTVETHLTSAYGKLGVRSRTELARLFAIDPGRAVLATTR
jgi:DNA-binding CsgD family transcriptional regulator